MIVDVRTPAEFQFQGAAGKVDSIQLEGTATPLTPDLGKVRFSGGGKFLEYAVAGKQEKIEIDKVVELITSPIAVNVPCATWNQETKEMDPAVKIFSESIEQLARDGVKVAITMCNSGGRSTACVAKFISDELASRIAAFTKLTALVINT